MAKNGPFPFASVRNARNKAGSPRLPAEKKHRAFVAAPLISTILFLSAVLFTVNLNKIEAAQSARIVNDAYHNRIVSLIDIYRTDLSSVFRESVRRNIQEYILDPGWNTLDLKNKQDVTGNFLNYRDIRLQRCEGIRKLSQEVVCSLGSKPVDASFGYGIPAWIEVASQNFSFEGIRFRPANQKQMDLLNPDRNDGAAVNAYAKSCRNLVQDNLFDCQYFADHPGFTDAAHPVGPFQCKDVNGVVLPGCLEGTFFMRVDPRGISPTNLNGDSALFAAMPRIEGDDGYGNQVRSGAIGYEVFYLPINLRVFYYDDFALEFYDRLAFNSDPSDPSRHPRPGGLVKGICSGSSEGCMSLSGIRNPIPGGTNRLDDPGKARAIDFVTKYFLNTPYRNAYTTLIRRSQNMPQSENNPAGGKYAQFFLMYDSIGNSLQNKCLDDATHLPSSHCEGVLGPKLSPGGLQPPALRNIPNFDPKILSYTASTGTPPVSEYVSWYDNVEGVHFFVLDYKPEFKVVGTEPNHPSYGMNFYLNP
ncbi:hypothetical protein HY994_00210 [Candidatus Micrarchaeota archaeon]|nr:hypothetical protein [Candidatus Micrarchaeota archaeon]